MPERSITLPLPTPFHSIISRARPPNKCRRDRRWACDAADQHAAPREIGSVPPTGPGLRERKGRVGESPRHRQEKLQRPECQGLLGRENLLVERGVQGGVPQQVPLPLSALLLLPGARTLLRRSLQYDEDRIHLDPTRDIPCLGSR